VEGLSRTIVPLAGAVALLVPSVAGATVALDAKRIDQGLVRAKQAHWLKPPVAASYRESVAAAVSSMQTMPRGRAAVIASMLNEVAAQSGSYVSPRALALFSMLDTNVEYLQTHALPRASLDITGDDGVIYRWFAGRGFQFHPLADFGALNALVSGEDTVSATTLAEALVARGVPRGAGLRWEYYFGVGRGRPPWTSGMAQAVAAQALSKASGLLDDPSVLQAAGRAYAAVPGVLVRKLAQGPWIRLYSFDGEVVLNAQLQAIVSLLDYADATGDPGAAALADSMATAAQALLPRFDTGYWSLYELGGGEASLAYQRYVTQLLVKLAHRTQDPVWVDAAARFTGYIKEPPDIEPAPLDAPVLVYPEPKDGYLDTATVTFTLSKRSRVTLSAGGKATVATLKRGTNRLVWDPGALPPGTYRAQLTAVDLAGNRTSVTLSQPFVVAYDDAPAEVQAQLVDGLLSWQATDPGTPWLKLRLVLRADGQPTTVIELGLQQLEGSLPVTLPPGTWDVRLGAQNSAGLWAVVPFGTVTIPSP
jgi:hypothetical protein